MSEFNQNFNLSSKPIQKDREAQKQPELSKNERKQRLINTIEQGKVGMIEELVASLGIRQENSVVKSATPKKELTYLELLYQQDLEEFDQKLGLVPQKGETGNLELHRQQRLQNQQVSAPQIGISKSDELIATFNQIIAQTPSYYQKTKAAELNKEIANIKIPFFGEFERVGELVEFIRLGFTPKGAGEGSMLGPRGVYLANFYLGLCSCPLFGNEYEKIDNTATLAQKCNHTHITLQNVKSGNLPTAHAPLDQLAGTYRNLVLATDFLEKLERAGNWGGYPIDEASYNQIKSKYVEKLFAITSGNIKMPRIGQKFGKNLELNFTSNLANFSCQFELDLEKMGFRPEMKGEAVVVLVDKVIEQARLNGDIKPNSALSLYFEQAQSSPGGYKALKSNLLHHMKNSQTVFAGMNLGQLQVLLAMAKGLHSLLGNSTELQKFYNQI